MSETPVKVIQRATWIGSIANVGFSRFKNYGGAR